MRRDGIYAITPGIVSQTWNRLLVNNNNENQTVNVYCDMLNGGLTYLFRKHLHSNTEFQVGIETYKNGFGDLEEDFFIGKLIYFEKF